MKQKVMFTGFICLLLTASFACNILDFAGDLFQGNTDEDISTTPTTPILAQTDTLSVEEITPEKETPEHPTETITLTVPGDTPEPEGLNPVKPYIVYGGEGGVWVSNPDGRFLTQVYEGRYYTALEEAISPDGSKLALVTQDQEGINLILVSIPDGEQEHIAQLLAGPITDAASDRAFASYAILDTPNLAWQPGEGRFLAFIGAIEGPTADLYLLDIQTREITQLTDGLSQAIMPVWSPNGTFILHYGVSWVPPFGGAIVGPTRMDGAWAVRVADEAVLPMPTPATLWPDFITWIDDGHYLSCDEDILREITVDSKNIREILPCCCGSNLAHAPTTNNLLLNISNDCNKEYEEGLYLLSLASETPVKVFDQTSWEINWLPVSNGFFAYPEVVITADGLRTFLPPELNHSFKPTISPRGYIAWVTYTNTVPYVRIQVPNQPWKMISNERVETMIWDGESGQVLLMVINDGRLLAAEYPDFIPQQIGDFGGWAQEAFFLP